MRPDVFDLQAFYDGAEGHLARRLIQRALRRFWPDLERCRLLGIGYPLPFLPNNAGAYGIAVMPHTQGARPWLAGRGNRVALARDDELPFADGVFERVLLVHALEGARHPNRLLREVWRVLADGGRLLVVVPNRHGLWCWSERTPFGYGHPYTVRQLQRLLRAQLLEPVSEGHALYMPPVRSALLRRLAIPLERFGLRLFPQFSGVLMIEAEKRIYVAPPICAEECHGRRRYVAVQPAMVHDRVPQAGAGEPALQGRASRARRSCEAV